MRLIIVITILVAYSQVFAIDDQKDGWQFHKFFGTYTTENESCPMLVGKVFIGYKHNENYPFFKITPLFSTNTQYYTYLKNSKKHGEECYECDPDWWETEEVSGNGISNAIFKRFGITPYNHSKYSTVIEIVRSDTKLYLKFDGCKAELIKDTHQATNL